MGHKSGIYLFIGGTGKLKDNLQEKTSYFYRLILLWHECSEFWVTEQGKKKSGFAGGDYG